MSILYDAVVAFLCCAGIIVTFLALFLPRSNDYAKVAGVVISENLDEILKNVLVLKRVFKEIIVVTRIDLNEIVPEDIKVISPEEFEVYVAGKNQN